MRIVIPTTGSRGDVQPYLALGVGLRAAGHEFCLATHADFESLIRGHGLDFFPMEENARALHETEAGREMIRRGNNPLVFMRQFVRMRLPLLPRLLENCLQACVDADLILAPTTGLLLSQMVGEKLGIPVLPASYVPLSPSRSVPNLLLPELPSWCPGHGLYNLLSSYAIAEAYWQFYRPALNDARRQVLGLPPVGFLGPSTQTLRQGPILYGYSSAVIPRPPDWGPKHHITGYWFLDSASSWQPSAVLRDFLDAGPPPVYVGFGSMHNEDPEAVTTLVAQALQQTGQRGVLQTGWGGLGGGQRYDHIFLLDAVPHDWLFPRMAAVVHHGGAGTTGAGLRAGLPTVIVPFMGDQPFWGRRVCQLGVGPEPIPRPQLSVRRLADAIRQAVTRPEVRQRAAQLGQQVRAEDGVGRAVEVIEDFARTIPRSTQTVRQRVRPTPAGGNPHAREDATAGNQREAG